LFINPQELLTNISKSMGKENPLSIRPKSVATAARVYARGCPRVMARIRVANMATVRNSILMEKTFLIV
jgi:hypothetical protein